MMKNTIIKFLIATLLLPGFLSLLPVGLASEIHGIQHDSNRVAGIQHSGHLSSDQSSSNHEHSVFTHKKSDHHLLVLDLSSYFSEYLNVDLHSLPEGIASLDDGPNEIGLLLQVVHPCFIGRRNQLDQCSDDGNEEPPFPSVLSMTKRLRI